MPRPAPTATPRTSGRVGLTSLTASPSVSLAVAVIHTIQDDERKGEEAKLHLGGRAGERLLSKSGNWIAHPRSRRPPRCYGRRRGRVATSPAAPLWSVRRRQHLSSLEPGRRGEAEWREPRGDSCLFARPDLRKGGRGARTHPLARAAGQFNPERTAAGNLEWKVIYNQ